MTAFLTFKVPEAGVDDLGSSTFDETKEVALD
jgi:hypothetical protein